MSRNIPYHAHGAVTYINKYHTHTHNDVTYVKKHLPSYIWCHDICQKEETMELLFCNLTEMKNYHYYEISPEEKNK